MRLLKSTTFIERQQIGHLNMSTISLTTFALFSLLVIPSFPFYKSIHPLNLIPLNGPFVELLFNKIIFPFPIPHCNNRKSIFIGFFFIICMNQIFLFLIICMNQIVLFCVIKVYFFMYFF